MIHLSSHIKDAFDKFEHDFLASNLPEGKYIKPPPSTAKWYKVGQPCYENKIQELNTDFLKICISAAPISGPFDALIDDGITFNASIKKPKFGMPKKG